MTRGTFSRRPGGPSRRLGVVLPIVVILSLLMGLSLIAFHFVSSGDYALVHRMLFTAKMGALVDLAYDEMRLQVERGIICKGPPTGPVTPPAGPGAPPALPGDPGGPTGPGTTPGTTPANNGPGPATPANPLPIPPFAEALRRPLDAARLSLCTAARPVEKLEVQEIAKNLNDKMPLTMQLAELSGAQASVSIELAMGPFKVIPEGQDPKLFYGEPVFEDRDASGAPKTDLRAWHMRGPAALKVQAKIAGTLSEAITVTRNLEVAITDTSAPAADFAFMSYMPPKDADMAYNDLQRGGRMAVNPLQQGRVMVRGPMLLLPEDGVKPESVVQAADAAAGTSHLGKGELDISRPDESVSYPLGATSWQGWSAIPGPRALTIPPADMRANLGAVWNVIRRLVGQSAVDPQSKAIRPTRKGSPEHTIGPISTPIPTGVSFSTNGSFWPWNWSASVDTLTLGPWKLPPLSVLAGVGGGGNAGVVPGFWWTLFGDDDVARFAPSSYFYGPRPPGKQTFSVLGFDNGTAPSPGGSTSRDTIRGVKIDSAGAATKFDGSFSELQADTTSPDGATVTVEPVPRTDGSAAGKDVGILLGAAAAQFRIKNLCDVGARAMVQNMMLPQLVSGVLDGILNGLGLNPDLYIVFRQWSIDPVGTLDGTISQSTLDPLVTGNRLVLLPYGLHNHKHDRLTTDTLAKAFLDLQDNALKGAFMLRIGGVQIPGLISALFNAPDATPSTIQRNLDSFFAGQQQDPQSFTNQIASGLAATGKWLEERILDATGAIGGDGNRQAVAGFFDRTGQRNQQRWQNALSQTPNAPASAFMNRIFGVTGPETPPTGGVTIKPEALMNQDRFKAAAKDYPNGFFPSKYANWATIATRTYKNFDEFLKRERVGGVLILRGIALVKEAKFEAASANEEIQYSGQGIVVVVTPSKDKPATLNVRLRPKVNEPGNWLILVHQVAAALESESDLPPLKLGQIVVGTVYSDTGVAPAGSETLIQGNLVVGNINKKAISMAGGDDPRKGLHVVYAPQLKGTCDCNRPVNWSMELLSGSTAGP